MNRWLALLLLAACGDDATPALDAGMDAASVDASTDAAEGSDAGEEGPVRVFASVGGSNEGIAAGFNLAGDPVLFVSLLDGPLVEIGIDGSVNTLATLDSPLGIAVRDDGSLVVCVDGGLVSLALDGTVTPLVETGTDQPFEITNYVVIAPDGSLVFSDSEADRVYRTQADGSAIELITDAINYPNGLAFIGNRLLVASYEGEAVYGADFADGVFGEFTIDIPNVDFVDGVVAADDGSVYLVTSTDGVLRSTDESVEALIDPRAIFLPANGTFGSAGFPEDTLYVTSLGTREVFAIDLTP
ncbi:MAG: SMP-30/gluconolactonase/LRE family protein [Myxococcota bacterium]